MKTIFALVVASLIGSSAMASGNLRVNIASGNNDLTVVKISNVKMCTFEIDVKNENGEVVFYKETIAPANNYKRNYDFSRLENGTYFFTVRTENELTETELAIRNGEVKIVDERKVVDPVFLMDNKQLKMTYLNFEQEKPRLLVYDKSRTVLYEKQLEANVAIHHGLDFSKSPRGMYEVVLSSGNEVHSYDVYID